MVYTFEDVSLPENVIVRSGTMGVTGTVTANMSGQGTFLPATQTVQVSGQGVFLPSDQVVKISGEAVKIQPPASVTIGRTQLSNESGGTPILSGAIVAITLRNVSESGDIFINSQNNARSGTGFVLRYDDTVYPRIEVDAFDEIYAFAEMSGDYIAYIGEVA